MLPLTPLSPISGGSWLAVGPWGHRELLQEELPVGLYGLFEELSPRQHPKSHIAARIS